MLLGFALIGLARVEPFDVEDADGSCHSPEEWRAMVKRRDAIIEDRDTTVKDLSEEVDDLRDEYQRMVLFCDRQQSEIDELKKQIRKLTGQSASGKC